MKSTSDIALGNKTLLLFEADLQQRQVELRRAIDRLRREIRALADLGGAEVQTEPGSNSSMEAIFASYTRTRAQLQKTEIALQRITAGDFGTCAVCGGAIGLKRLQALPHTSNCIECQERSEQRRVQ